MMLRRILNEEMDDVLSLVDGKKHQELQQYEKLVQDYLLHWTTFCFEETRGLPDRRHLAEKYKNHLMFTCIMKSINKTDEEEVKEIVQAFLLNRYSKEEKAKEFIQSL